MKLEEVYKIIKNLKLDDLYIPSNFAETIFIYKNDVQLTISKVEIDNDVFGYKHFFDENNKVHNYLSDADKVVLELCRLKDFPETYEDISIETWGVKYNGVDIYQLSSINIFNPSSLHTSLPLTLKPYDYELNFCLLCNDYYGANKNYIANDIIKSNHEIQESNFEDFLRN